MEKGAEFQGEEWSDFAHPQGRSLVVAGEVGAGDPHRPCGRQGAVYAGEDAGNDVINGGAALGVRRSVGEEINGNGIVADLLLVPDEALGAGGFVKAFLEQSELQAGHAAGRCAKRNADVGIDGDRPGERARDRSVPADVARHQAADEHEIVVPGFKVWPNGEQRAFSESNPPGIVVSVGPEFHSRQKPSQLRKAAA